MAQFHSLVLFCGQINLLTVQTNHFKMRGAEYDSRFVCLPLTRCGKQSSSSNEAGVNCYYSCSQSVIIVQCNGELGRKQQRSVSHKELARVIAPQDGVAWLLLLHLHHVDVCGLENLSVGALPDHWLKTMDNICLWAILYTLSACHQISAPTNCVTHNDTDIGIKNSLKYATVKPKLVWGRYLFPFLTMNRPSCTLPCTRLTPPFSAKMCLWDSGHVLKAKFLSASKWPQARCHFPQCILNVVEMCVRVSAVSW